MRGMSPPRSRPQAFLRYPLCGLKRRPQRPLSTARFFSVELSSIKYYSMYIILKFKEFTYW